MRQLDGRDISTKFGSTAVNWCATLGVIAVQAFQLFQNLVEPQALDKLHHVIRHAIVLSDAEHRDDVRVVQPGG